MKENNCLECAFFDKSNIACSIKTGSPLRKCVTAINKEIVGYLHEKQGLDFLEIGCGSWSYVFDNAKNVINWEGIDIVDFDISGKPNIHTKKGSVEKIPFEDGKFDIVLANQSIEHWFEYGVTFKKGLSEISRVLKEGGEFLINVPIHLHGHKVFLKGEIDSIKRIFNNNFWEIKKIKSWRKNPHPLSPYRAWREQVITNCFPKDFNNSSWTLEIVVAKRSMMKLNVFDNIFYLFWKLFYKLFPKRILQIINYPKKALLNIIINRIKMFKDKIYNFLTKGPFRKFFLKKSIWLNNYSYSLIKKFLLGKGEKHPKHRIVNYNKFFIKNISPEDVVLDVGSFGGETCFALAPRIKRAIGIELEKNKVDNANKNNNFTNVEFICGDATVYDFSSLGIDKFDKVILSNVLEHIENRVEFLKKISKLSNTILLRVPMLSRDWLTVYKKEKGYEYRLDPDHEIEYTDESLENELKESGWIIKEKTVQFGETWAVLERYEK